MVARVELKGVGLEVTSPVTVRILHPLDLELQSTESVALIGPSGAGKTTLASIIGALQPPSEGVYRFDGVEITGLAPPALARFRRDSVGFVFQQAHLIDERSAWRNVALGIDDDSSAAVIEQRSRDALDAVGLSSIADRSAALLSGGERQRVAIARAIAKNPRLIIADEPTGSLDQSTGSAVLDLLFRLARSDTTLIVVTHDLRAADRADRVVSIIDGRLA